MRKIFKNAFNRETLQPFAIGVGTVLLIEFIIFPGLTVKNLFVNFLSTLMIVVLIKFTIQYLRSKF